MTDICRHGHWRKVRSVHACIVHSCRDTSRSGGACRRLPSGGRDSQAAVGGPEAYELGVEVGDLGAAGDQVALPLPITRTRSCSHLRLTPMHHPTRLHVHQPLRQGLQLPLQPLLLASKPLGSRYSLPGPMSQYSCTRTRSFGFEALIDELRLCITLSLIHI